VRGLRLRKSLVGPNNIHPCFSHFYTRAEPSLGGPKIGLLDPNGLLTQPVTPTAERREKTLPCRDSPPLWKPPSVAEGGTRRDTAKSCKGLAMELVKCLAETDCVKVCLPLPPTLFYRRLALPASVRLGANAASFEPDASPCHFSGGVSATDGADSLPEFSVDAGNF
jgi:hypothetical protein